ncbi:MAG: hypothetical protein ACI9J3_000084 [Parvicellaceae bacterium]|jgi:hypothetical protein
MNMFKSILQEGTSMLNEHSIPVFLFQLFALLVLVVLVKMIFKKKQGESMSFPLLSLAMSLGILMPFIKYSNAIGLVFIGVCILLFKSIETKKSEVPFVVLALSTSIAVGSGFWILGLIGWTIAMIVILLVKK